MDEAKRTTEPDGQDADLPTRERRQAPSRRAVVTTSVIGSLVAVGAVVAVLSPAFSGADAPNDAATPAPTTVRVERKDVPTAVVGRGTIGYPARGELVSQRSGVVTGLPPVGAVVAAGTELVRIDERPVVAFPGTVPAWRSLAVDVPDGPDVEQLERGLGALGYFRGTVDRKFTAVTEAGIERWQKAVGVEPTGEVAFGDVVFVPEDVRVASTKLSSGASIAAGDAIASLASSAVSVRADVASDDRAAVVPDAPVTVTLADGRTAAGRVSAVGDAEAVPAAGTGSGDAQDTDADTTATAQRLPVSVRFDDPAALSGATEGSVRVDIQGKGLVDAVVVPVDAVMAQRSDRYGVQVVHKGTVRTRTIEIGRVVDGSVEVTRGLEIDERVVVPR